MATPQDSGGTGNGGTGEADENLTCEESNQAERRQFLLERLGKLGAKLDVARGTWRTQTGRQWTPEEAAAKAWMSWSSIPLRVFVEEAREVVREAHEALWCATRDRLLDDNADRAAAGQELHKFVRLMAKEDSTDDEYLYYEVALRQLVWQVKRKLRGLDTKWDTMVVFVGGQGTGKSESSDKLGKPLGMFYMADADLSILNDKFRIQQLNYKFLVRFDEMENGRNVQVQTLKRNISTKVLAGRAMRSETEREVERNASFIGTSNRSVAEDIPDVTGNRRFAEIPCRQSRVTVAWGRQMDALDFHLLWQCEDGRSEVCPVQHNLELVMRMQERERVLSDFDAWADECIVPLAEARTDSRDVYASYKSWMGEQNRSPIGKNIFLSKCKTRWEVVKPSNRVHFCDIIVAKEDV